MTSARIALHPDVPGDLAEIVEYIAARNASAAHRLAAAAKGTLEFLAPMPGLGSLKNYEGPEYEGIRTWFVRGFRNYLIVYRPIDGGIHVLAIVHGARDIPAFLRRRLRPPDGKR
jgi:toxin ParE1/3/4